MTTSMLNAEILLSDKSSLWWIKFASAKGAFNMAMRRKQLQILQTIITSIFIMMYFFALLQQASKMFLHYKAVLSHITTFVSTWMLRGINKSIPIPHSYSTLPRPALFTFRGIGMATLPRTISDIGITGKKYLTTIGTNSFMFFKCFGFNASPNMRITPHFNKLMVAFKGASNPLLAFWLMFRNFPSTKNTLYHNSIISQLTNNVKEVYNVN